MVEKNLKAAFHTLGCKLNFSETSAIGKVLSERGVTRAARGDSPDIISKNLILGITSYHDSECDPRAFARGNHRYGMGV